MSKVKIKVNGSDTNIEGVYTSSAGTTLSQEDIIKLLGFKLYEGRVRVIDIANFMGWKLNPQTTYIDILTGKEQPVEPKQEAPKEQPKRLAGKRIALDPGHGSGSNRSPLNGAYNEGDYVLKVGKDLKEKLEAEGAIVLLTRTDGRNISLEERAKMINDFNPDICISIHTNAGGGQGTEVIHSIHRPNDPFSNLVYQEIISTMGFMARRVFSKKSDVNPNQDYFAMIRAIKCHSIIIEPGFHDNAVDLAILLKADSHILYATAVKNALIKHFNK